jgi:hypothetical protein
MRAHSEKLGTSPSASRCSSALASGSGQSMDTIFLAAAILGGLILTASFILTLLQDR